MDKEELEKLIHEYIKENMHITVDVNKSGGTYSENINVTVSISLAGEEICSDFSYTST